MKAQKRTITEINLNQILHLVISIVPAIKLKTNDQHKMIKKGRKM